MRCPVCGRAFDHTGVVNRQGVIMCKDCSHMMREGPSTERPVAEPPATDVPTDAVPEPPSAGAPAGPLY